MTVATEYAPAEFLWTGVETGFAPGFSAREADNVRVVYRVGAVNTTLTRGVHFSVALGDNNAVTVAPLAMPAAPGFVAISRFTPDVQATPFVNLASYAPLVHENLHDAAAMRDGEIRADITENIAALAQEILDRAAGDAALAGIATEAIAARDRAEAARDEAEAIAAAISGSVAGGFANRAIVEAYAPPIAPSYLLVNGETVGGDTGGGIAALVESEPKGYGGNLIEDDNPGTGTGWNIAASGAATHVTGTSALAIALGTYGIPPLDRIVVGQVYKIQTRVTGRTAGTVTPRLTGGTTVNAAAIAANGFNEQLVTALTGNVALEYLPTGAFDGTIAWRAIRLQVALPAKAKYQITLADTVTSPWYERRPDEITPFMCGATRPDDSDNLAETCQSLLDAAEWGMAKNIPILIPPIDGEWLIDAGFNKATRPAFFTIGYHKVTGDPAYGQASLVLKGAGLATRLKHIGTTWSALLSVDEAKNVDISQLCFDGGWLDTFPLTDPDVTGQGFIAGDNGMIERLRLHDLYIKGTRSYAIGLQNSDILDGMVHNIHIRDVANDGFDIKAREAPATVVRTHRKKPIFIHNIRVKNIDMLNVGDKSGIDLRGDILASRLYVELDAGRDDHGVRFSADVESDNGRKGARKAQVSNVYVLDNSGPDAVLPNKGIGVYNNFVNLANAVVEFAAIGFAIDAAGDSIPVGGQFTNITILGAQQTDLSGIGIRLDSTSGVKTHHIEAMVANCDTGLAAGATGFPTGISGRITLRNCTKGHSLTLAQLASAADLTILNDQNDSDNNLGIVERHIALDLALSGADATQKFTRRRLTAGDAVLDFDAIPADGASDALIRFFRNCVTSGVAALLVSKPGDAAINGRIAGQGDSWVAADNGNFGVGGQAPAHKLDVTGNAKASLGFIFPEYTAAQIASAAHAVNTTAKFKNKVVADSTNDRLMIARGGNPTDNWKVVDGSAAVTPS